MTSQPGLLERTVGGDALDITLGGLGVPLTDSGAVRIRHGRTTPDQQPDAATCTLTIRSTALPSLPTIGDALDVELSGTALDWLGLTGPARTAAAPRFRGTVTDISARPESAIAGPAVVTVVAVGHRARLGGTPVGDAPWPAELDGDRAAAILTAAATADPQIVPGTIDPGTLTVLARDVDRQDALGLLDQLARDTGGLLVDRRDGTLDWQDAEHRRDAPVAVVLTDANVLAPTAATQNRSGLLNDLTVGYGSANPQDTVRVVDTWSTAQPWGTAAAPVGTQLATAADASSYARTAVGRRARPRWSTPAMTVDLLSRFCTPSLAAQLLALEVSDLVSVTGFPATGPFAAADLWLEGWEETVTRQSWLMALDVSDYRLTGPPLRWQDVPPGVRWSDVPADLRWLDALFSVTASIS